MKVAQMLSTIPDVLPADFAAELMRLQSQAPPMGAAFVRRRMQAELGPNWRDRFSEFDLKPAAAASLGQVHRATSLGGEKLACKLQYPDMASAVETDLSNLDLLFSLRRRMGAPIDTREIASEIRERVREELDYQREAKIARLYRVMLADRPFVRVPRVEESLSTRRLLDAAMARRRAARRLRDGSPGGARRDRGRPIRGVVAPVPALRRHPRRSASRQLHGRRVGEGESDASTASTCSTMAACASSRRGSCAAWSSSIGRSRPMTRRASPRPMRCGAFRSSRPG